MDSSSYHCIWTVASHHGCRWINWSFQLAFTRLKVGSLRFHIVLCLCWSWRVVMELQYSWWGWRLRSKYLSNSNSFSANPWNYWIFSLKIDWAYPSFRCYLLAMAFSIAQRWVAASCCIQNRLGWLGNSCSTANLCI